MRKLALRGLLRRTQDRDEHLRRIVGLVEDVSYEAPVASLVMGAAVLLARHGQGQWPYIDLEASPRGTIANISIREFADALHVGRVPTVTNAQTARRLAATPAAAALTWLQREGVVFDRRPRTHGDTQPLWYEATTQRAAAVRSWGAGAVHGLPARMLASLRAALLRAIADAIAADEVARPADAHGSAWRAEWRRWQKGPALRSVALAMRREVMGLTARRDADSKRVVSLTTSGAVAAVLREPFVADLVARHCEWLWGDVPASAAPPPSTPPLCGAPALSRRGGGPAPRGAPHSSAG